MGLYKKNVDQLSHTDKVHMAYKGTSPDKDRCKIQ